MLIHPIMRRAGLVVVAVVGAACSDSVEPVVVLPPSGPVDREETDRHVRCHGDVRHNPRGSRRHSGGGRVDDPDARSDC